MIISRHRRFIFFAVPKTGTHSVRRALRPHLAEDDLEQVGLFVQKRFPFPELNAIGHGHLSVRQVHPVLGAETFDNYFKFAFVRNPFDRFVSYCAFMSRQTGSFEVAPQAFMRHIVRDAPPWQHVLFRPQHEMLVDAAGRVAMDMLGRVENMQADYDRICGHIGIPSTKLEQVNASRHRPYMEYYDDELRSLVARMYARDFELLGYDADGHADTR
ncbi:sulfotransferase family 2 domain-containing protein [Dokdonella sp.]|uniref:sulfotransferase family 2 domain-containing protein n=1 Tax=Dokdonella sp. TaxID=2291710 RepID=UPI0025C3436C|nr:sulfotransferase family 2 domain-containing protein [Dokdonella sp.]MBX3692206.1 sulfotransferase family 2 domain-containing protein [Dokdonella sp.]MCW5567296.1 sulfotransferase family 2 domain-containing protein [Dokdonella sp.]